MGGDTRPLHQVSAAKFDESSPEEELETEKGKRNRESKEDGKADNAKPAKKHDAHFVIDPAGTHALLKRCALRLAGEPSGTSGRWTPARGTPST